jgi:alpha-beta hydrolase superfamily lysophospholipase
MVAASIQISGPNGLSLFARLWEPRDKPTCVICLVHGLGEHSGRYEHVGNYFAQRGYAVLAIDLPGHGKTGGKRGHINKYADLMDLMPAFLNRAKERYPSVPVVLYGHSMGGNIVTNFVLRHQPEVKAAVVTGPFFRLAFEPPKLKVKLASLMKGIYPAWSEKNTLNTAHLSHDQKVVDAYIQDPLVHDRITAGLFFGIHEAGEWAIAHASELTIPMLVLHGGDDQLTSPKGSSAFAKNAGSKVTHHEWPELYHEIHNEPQKLEVLDQIFKWVNSQL